MLFLKASAIAFGALVIAVSYFALVRWIAIWIDTHVYSFMRFPQKSLAGLVAEGIGLVFIISVPWMYHAIHSYAVGRLLVVTPWIEWMSLVMPFIVLLPFAVWWLLKNLRFGF